MKQIIVLSVAGFVAFLIWIAIRSNKAAEERDARELAALEQASHELDEAWGIIRAQFSKLQILLGERRDLSEEVMKFEGLIIYGVADVQSARDEREMQLIALEKRMAPIGSELMALIADFDARLAAHTAKLTTFAEKRKNISPEMARRFDTLPRFESFVSLGEQIRRAHRQAGVTSR